MAEDLTPGEIAVDSVNALVLQGRMQDASDILWDYIYPDGVLMPERLRTVSYVKMCHVLHDFVTGHDWKKPVR